MSENDQCKTGHKWRWLRGDRYRGPWFCRKCRCCAFADETDLVGHLNPKYKTELCRNWPGRCSHGDKCIFAHGKRELRPIVTNNTTTVNRSDPALSEYTRGSKWDSFSNSEPVKPRKVFTIAGNSKQNAMASKSGKSAPVNVWAQSIQRKQKKCKSQGDTSDRNVGELPHLMFQSPGQSGVSPVIKRLHGDTSDPNIGEPHFFELRLTSAQDPVLWGIEDVRHWLDCEGLSKIRFETSGDKTRILELFGLEEIDGEELLNLEKSELEDLGLNTVGKKKKFWRKLQALRQLRTQ